MIIFKNKIFQDHDNQYFGFTCDSRMNYFADIYETLHGKNGSVDKIIYGINDRCGGTVCELIMVWYLIDGQNAPRLEVFSDYFDELSKVWHTEVIRQVKLLGKETFTSEEFSRVLIKLGFEDMSDIKLEIEKT